MLFRSADRPPLGHDAFYASLKSKAHARRNDDGRLLWYIPINAVQKRNETYLLEPLGKSTTKEDHERMQMRERERERERSSKERKKTENSNHE